MHKPSDTRGTGIHPVSDADYTIRSSPISPKAKKDQLQVSFDLS